MLQHHAVSANPYYSVMPGSIPSITPRDLRDRVERGDELVVIDVREPWEVERAAVSGAQFIPLQTLPQVVHSLDRNAEYVIMCHHGLRSEMATEWMLANGFRSVTNLEGGIDAWSRDVDPTIPQY